MYVSITHSIRICTVLLLLLCSINILVAQEVITGKVLDAKGQAVAGASVLLKRNGISKGYAVSDAQGYFKLQDAYADSSLLMVSHLSYRRLEVAILKGKSHYVFTLVPADNAELPDVVVTPPPMERRGDTVRYRVNGFASAGDRVIGDVIDKLPGISRNEMGQITYQGKPISRYYIDGLDLMGAKYGLANESIRFDLVDAVEVVERHQHIRVLDSVAPRNEVALNLKLSSKARGKWSGQVHAGTGLPVPLYEGELNLMNFKPGFQTLNILKANNAGHNVVQQNAELITDTRLPMLVQDPLLSLPAAQFPNVSEQRQLINETVFPSLNFLKAAGNGLQHRFNVSMYRDQRTNVFGSRQFIVLPDDTIQLEERNEWLKRVNHLGVGYQLERNNADGYLESKTDLKVEGIRQQTLMEGTYPSLQELQTPWVLLDNRLKWIKKPKSSGSINRLESYTRFSRREETLNILPGVFENFLNNGERLDAISQQTKLHTFVNNTSWQSQQTRAGWRHGWFGRSNVEWSQFRSLLQKDSSNVQIKMGYPFQNDFNLTILSLQGGYTAGRMIKNGNISFELPLGLQWMHRKSSLGEPSVEKILPLVLPSLTFEKKKKDFIFRLQSKTDFRSLNPYEAFTGFVASDYRTVQAYSRNFLLQHVWINGGGVQYNNPVKGWSGYLSGLYSITFRNLLPENVFNDIFVTRVYLAERNRQKMLNLLGGFGKYFFGIKGGVQVGMQFNRFETPSVQNGIAQTFTNQVLNGQIKFFTRQLSFLHIETVSKANWQRSFNDINGSLPQAVFFSQQFNLSGILFKGKLQPGVAADFGRTKQSGLTHSFAFLDASVSYRSAKMEWRLTGTNLLGEDLLVMPISSLNTAEQRYLQLRERNILLKVIFIL